MAASPPKSTPSKLMAIPYNQVSKMSVQKAPMKFIRSNLRYKKKTRAKSPPKPLPSKLVAIPNNQVAMMSMQKAPTEFYASNLKYKNILAKLILKEKRAKSPPKSLPSKIMEIPNNKVTLMSM